VSLLLDDGWRSRRSQLHLDSGVVRAALRLFNCLKLSWSFWAERGLKQGYYIRV
jgi:uncharacterized membrane protein YccC